MSLTYDPNRGNPNVVLFGYDIFRLYEELPEPVYLYLCIDDYEGESLFTQSQIFDSLKQHTYQPETREIYINDGDITIFLENPYRAELVLADPRRLLHISKRLFQTRPKGWKNLLAQRKRTPLTAPKPEFSKRSQLESASLYYNENKPVIYKNKSICETGIVGGERIGRLPRWRALQSL